LVPLVDEDVLLVLTMLPTVDAVVLMLRNQDRPLKPDTTASESNILDEKQRVPIGHIADHVLCQTPTKPIR
jgi:hypothetical protein